MEERRPGEVFKIVPIIIVLVILGAYFFGIPVGARLHPDMAASSMVELTEKVSKQIDDGNNEGIFYLSNITNEELDKINEVVISLNGTVKSYSIIQKSRGGMKIKLRYEISDNYYVYQQYKFNKRIPSDKLAAKKLYDQVDFILKSIIKPGMTDYEKELAIHDYIVSHCSYGYTDYSKEYAYRAYGALIQQKAVCNGYAEAMALLLSCVDVENEFVTGTADGELHAWNSVKLDGAWYQVDATWDDPLPDRGEFVGHSYFNITDDMMDDRHVWEKDNYHPCESLNYNYFKMNNLVGDYEHFKDVVRATAHKNITGSVEVAVTDFDEATYDMSFLQGTNGILSVKYSNEPLGSWYIVSVYLNK